MPQFSLIRAVFAVTAVIAMVAGCAAANVDPGRAASAAPSATPWASDQPALDALASAPARSVAPTGPAATAAMGTPPPQGPHATAHVGSLAIACPDEPWPGLESNPPLAKDVVIKAVVRCEPVQRTYSSLGEWSVQLAEVANHGFDELVAALHEPSQKAPPNQACPDIGYVIPWFVLVTADGEAARAAIPTGTCGKPHADATKALQSLPFEVVDAVRVRQLRSPESIASGCEQRFKDMVAIEGARASAGSKGGSVADLASVPSSVLACLYQVAGAGVPEGELIKGVTVTGESAADIASGAEIANSIPSGCVDADRFVVVAAAGSIGYVEVGACNRLLTPDGRLGTASAALVATLESVLQGS